MFQLICKDGHARRGAFTTPHGTVQTPVFMNVGTQAAIKGALSAEDLETIGCQVELSNTYHLHVRPGDELIRDLGGLHKFMTWEKPILTDSGGFQIFSLGAASEDHGRGVAFNCHVDGRHIFMGPEESMRIQANLGSDIAMAFDECIKIPSPYDYVKDSCDRTYRWLQRCKAALTDYTGRDDAVNPGQVLFGINQGTIFHDLRIEHMKKIADLDLAGYAIGGLAVGETTQEMYDTIAAVEPYMPADKPRYLMGVGTPGNIIESVARGVDFSSRHAGAQRPATDICSRGQASSTLKMRNISAMSSRSTRSATARSAGGIPAPICGTCSRRKRCWPCALP